MDDARIEVHGLREYQQALRDVDRALGPELRRGLNEVAEVVASAARPLVPHRTGKAAGSIKVGSTQRAAQVKVGGDKAPYFMWLDFGGSTGRGHRPRTAASGSVRRPFVKEGRYIYPTLRRKRPEMIAKLEEVLARLTARAGF